MPASLLVWMFDKKQVPFDWEDVFALLYRIPMQLFLSAPLAGVE